MEQTATSLQSSENWTAKFLAEPMSTPCTFHRLKTNARRLRLPPCANKSPRNCGEKEKYGRTNESDYVGGA